MNFELCIYLQVETAHTIDLAKALSLQLFLQTLTVMSESVLRIQGT